MADKYSDKYVEQFLNTYVLPVYTNPVNGTIRNIWNLMGSRAMCTRTMQSGKAPSMPNRR